MNTYFKTIGQPTPRNLANRWIELKRHKDMIEAELKAITAKVVADPSSYDAFNVISATRTNVPQDVIKAYVGQEWWEQNSVTIEQRPYIRLK